jgi:hypothetical protein
MPEEKNQLQGIARYVGGALPALRRPTGLSAVVAPAEPRPPRQPRPQAPRPARGRQDARRPGPRRMESRRA